MYVVVENTPGYLPEVDDPYTTQDFEEAVRHAKYLVSNICDDYIDSTPDDSIPGLLHAEREHETLWRVTFNEPHRLDRVVEILEEGN